MNNMNITDNTVTVRAASSGTDAGDNATADVNYTGLLETMSQKPTG